MKALVTGGGCEEPIDGVRFVANFSTGKTSARIAQALREAGHDVTLLTGLRATVPEGDPEAPPTALGRLEIVRFRTFADLAVALQTAAESDSYDLIVHAAAVSDYSVESVDAEGARYAGGTVPKLESAETLTVRLVRNPKLADSLRDWTRHGAAPEKPCTIVAFKLTNGASEEERGTAAESLLERTDVDLVISNDLSEISGEKHPFRVYPNPRFRPDAPGGRLMPAAAGETLNELASAVLTLSSIYTHHPTSRFRNTAQIQGDCTP